MRRTDAAGVNHTMAISPQLVIRPIREHEVAQLRTIRLRAVAESPRAFEITLAEEQRAPAEHWIEWARQGAAGQTSSTFVAVQAEEWCGMAGGFLESNGPPVVATVFGVWVEPVRRGHGVGGMLVEAVVQWAVGRGAERVQLWVTEDNDAARMLYERHGFDCTGQRKPLRSDPSAAEVLMVRRLETSPPKTRAP
jgi:ribosomal protein S18 acetylase RimI-like enzyme